MKLKHYHIYLLAIVVFLIAFIGINNKYDRFYRITGMNNENRILVETYLDESEQNFMVENNIGVHEFIRYLTCPDFDIQNYEYYPIVERSNTYHSLPEIVTQTNVIVNKLRAESPWSISDNLNTIAQAKLLPDYMHNVSFNFKHISVYQTLKSFYVEGDYSYLTLVDSYLDALSDLGYTTFDEGSDVLVELFNQYSPSQVGRLIKASQTAGKAIFIIDPTEPTTVLNQDVFVDAYVPKDLELLEDLPRYTYFLYLRHDTYEALKAMCEAYEQSETYQSYYILSGYESYETIYEDNSALAGHKEEQLGMSVSFQVMGLAVEDFGSSSLSDWLKENAYQYGFILRYPEGKEATTGRAYQSYTYRYVGTEAASVMHEKNVSTLEEYNASIK